MWNGKMKALTFSFDDAVCQDVRFIEILNKYGLRGTFNINSNRLGETGRTLKIGGVEIPHDKINASDLRSIYEGHEVAAHTLDHPNLTTIADDNEIIRQVEEDRLRLSDLAGYEVVGFAYPCAAPNFNERVVKLIKENTGVKYCRTVVSSFSFDQQSDPYKFNPTLHQHANPREMFALGEKFLDMNPDTPQLFYIFGHAYEFDYGDGWERIESFCNMMSGRDDIFYGTNKEILLY